jgi:hypothetical protein
MNANSETVLLRWIRDHLAYEHNYCLIWPFGRNSSGYATFNTGGKQLYVHRYICEQVNGPPPSDKHQAAHCCARGHEGCVNPRHVSWKTPQENQMDRLNVGVPFTGRRRRLTREQVREIRASDDTHRTLAERFGIREMNIRRIRTGELYKT